MYNVEALRSSDSRRGRPFGIDRVGRVYLASGGVELPYQLKRSTFDLSMANENFFSLKDKLRWLRAAGRVSVKALPPG